MSTESDASDEVDYPDRSPDEIEFENYYRENTFFLTSLEADVVNSEKLMVLREGDEFSRRTFVRTVFAEIEGLAASAIDWARYYAAENSFFKHQYTTAERVVLLGTSARLNEKGLAELEPTQKFGTKATIRFALSLVGRGATDLPRIDYSGAGWNALQKAFDLRNRLMHPKAAADLELRRRPRIMEWKAYGNTMERLGV